MIENEEGEDGDPVDDWSNVDLSQLNEIKNNDEAKKDVATRKDKNKHISLRSKTTRTKKKKSTK